MKKTCKGRVVTLMDNNLEVDGEEMPYVGGARNVLSATAKTHDEPVRNHLRQTDSWLPAT